MAFLIIGILIRIYTVFVNDYIYILYLGLSHDIFSLVLLAILHDPFLLLFPALNELLGLGKPHAFRWPRVSTSWFVWVC